VSEQQRGETSASSQARAFWAQSRADLATAVTLLEAGVFYASVFFSQQAAEKALKAATARHQGAAARGHNLVQMAGALNSPSEILKAAAALHPYFVTARNPEHAGGGVPAQLFDGEKARACLRMAQDIVEWTRPLV